MSAASPVIAAPRRAWRRLRQGVSRGLDRGAMMLARMAPPATGFVEQPEPRSTGDIARGRQMLAGTYLSHGAVREHAGSPWTLDAPDLDRDLHGFGWVDDLVAVDTAGARAAVQDWLFDWIDRFGGGRGPGWAADVTGRRLVCWIHHAVLILSNRPPEDSRAYFRALSVQSRYLQRRWRSAPPGLPRFEALTGLVYAGLALEGVDRLLPSALDALGRECARQIGADGGLASRNPQALAEVFVLLSWVNLAVSATGRQMDVAVLRALERMAPAIRALRLGDGRLARFHGGDGGQAERIDRALADAGVRLPARIDGTMGYARLAAGGTVVLVDAAAPPRVGEPHASTLAFEMTSGRHPLLTSMGPGLRFARDQQRATRLSAAHCGLVIDGSSAGMLMRGRMVRGPRRVTAERDANEFGVAVLASHDGWRRRYGLVHTREIALVHSGREVQGTDRLRCTGDTDREKLDRMVDRRGDAGLRAEVLFRAHPDVTVERDLGGHAASLGLPGGVVWVLRAEGCEIALRPAQVLEAGRLQPRATQEVVVSFVLDSYETAMTWTLTRAD